MINIAGIEYSSIVDGPGVRTAIFVQGCSHNCEGCHNPETHEFYAGKNFSVDELFSLIEKSSISKKITLTGGDPIYQYIELLPLVKLLNKNNYNILVYTGFKKKVLEDLLSKRSFFEFMNLIDTIITEPFIKELQTSTIKFRGSSNQRVYTFSNKFIDITDEWDMTNG